MSTIAAIEIPRGEWTDLISNLCTNASSDVAQVKHASLQTLGFICEELQVNDLSPELKNAVVVALTTSIDKEEACSANHNTYPATKLAIRALLHSLPFAAQNFQVENERNFIMQKVFDACFVGDVDVRESAMQVLVELARSEYDTLHFSLQRITECTALVIEKDAGNVGAQAIEFWTSLADEELYRRKHGQPVANYIENIYDSLLRRMLQQIRKVGIDDDCEEDDEWGV